MKTQQPKLKTRTLTLAVAGILTVMAQAAMAQTVINTSITNSYSWTSGDLSITSTGAVSGYATALSTGNNVGTLTNNGSITGQTQSGFRNGGTVGAVINNGAIHGEYSGAVSNFGSIGTLTNNGTLSSHSEAVFNYTGSTITELDNTASGSMISNTWGIRNWVATIGTLNNAGLISGSGDGVNSIGTIGTLTNSGTIIGVGNDGIFNDGTIGSLTNSGTISGGAYAIYNTAGGTFGSISNSGAIEGNITNLSSQDLDISGGTGTIFGTLTGYGGTIGTIDNPASNVVFSSGNLLLNDNINVGSYAVNNNGSAVLQVNQPLTITGNYNQTGGTLQIGVAGTGTGQYGQLIVTGNSTMTSGSVNVVSNGYALAAGQRYVVVDTAGTANYGSGLNYSAGSFTATGSTTVTGGHTDLVVTLSSDDASTSAPTTTVTPKPQSLATAPNAIASLSGLMNYTGVSSSSLLNLYDATLGSLGEGSTPTANRIGKQLAPAQSGSAATTPTFDALNVVNAHVDSLRLAQGGGKSGVATGDSPLNWGVWGQAFGGHASQGEIDNVDGYSANYGGLLIGADKAITDNWRAGGVFTYSNTAVNSTGDTAGDTSRINGYGAIGYASYTGSPWYVNLSGGVVAQQYDTTRVVNLQGFSGKADGRFSGQQYVARAESGYPLAVRGFTVTPLASLTYSYQRQGAYTESGGNGAGLSVDASHVNSVKSALGAKLEKGFSTSYGEIVPDLQLQWIHEYNHSAQTTAASYAADPTGATAFTTVGARPVADLADLSLGATLMRQNNLSLSVHYELQAGHGFVSQTGTLRLRQLF